MQTIKQISQILEESDSLKLVAQAYSEIAAVKLQKIRKGIEQNRVFFQEVSEVFHIVKVASLRQGIKPAVTRKRGTLSILLTSNYRFYGSLESELVKFFIINTSKFRTDRIVIGKTGTEFLHTMDYFHPYQHIVLEEDLPNDVEIRTLVLSLIGYQQILVYYSRMQSVLIQEPFVTDIVQAPPGRIIDPKVRHPGYIFEPELDKMLQFFDSQITSLMLEQTFMESELARTAARLTSMDQAQMNADDLIKQQRKLLAVAKRSSDNLRLLETIATLRGWKKEES
ncbi:MAG: FoF1 ATP synthase subunit gamma [bacterium]|nr:FoF1 ATP synthase subunit gamma [bacterium]